MDVLQGDIDALEQEKIQLTKKLDAHSKKAIYGGIMGSRYTSSELLEINNYKFSWDCVVYTIYEAV